MKLPFWEPPFHLECCHYCDQRQGFVPDLQSCKVVHDPWSEILLSNHLFACFVEGPPRFCYGPGRVLASEVHGENQAAVRLCFLGFGDASDLYDQNQSPPILCLGFSSEPQGYWSRTGNAGVCAWDTSHHPGWALRSKMQMKKRWRTCWRRTC